MKESKHKLNLDNTNVREHSNRNQSNKQRNEDNKNEINNDEIKIIKTNNEKNIFYFNYKVKLNDIILNNNNIKERINEIELEIVKIIKNDSLNIQIKNINQNLIKIKEDINNSNEIIFNIIKNENKEEENNNTNYKTENYSISENKKYLSDIKSNVIIRKIFSFCNEKDKLKIVKYNKNLQNKMGVKLINYK